MSDFWTRRKEAVAQEKSTALEKERIAEKKSTPQDLSDKPDHEILEELGLPDPEEMHFGDDFKAFMHKTVPMHIRRRALRKLWLTNPVLANVDGLVDYGQDFTDAAVGAGVVETTYQVGKGMLRHLEALAEKEQREAAQADGEEPVDAPETELATAEDAPEEEAAPAPLDARYSPQTPSEDDIPTWTPAPRRMRFRLQEAPS